MYNWYLKAYATSVLLLDSTAEFSELLPKTTCVALSEEDAFVAPFSTASVKTHFFEHGILPGLPESRQVSMLPTPVRTQRPNLMREQNIKKKQILEALHTDISAEGKTSKRKYENLAYKPRV
ncbi:hypothetical protein F1559_003705 [Cyanidiococcus yangmingshanensis]|uniref:Uncharacterized protein n=1 Tax=Cyanidiococcus yangmingshanensis TaxID=2690220 RepID=A0A7J7IIG6_9RHOD|nr:hypothetical protein F1559_003705 [Cyanidiococcus yangmingshanensis]